MIYFGRDAASYYDRGGNLIVRTWAVCPARGEPFLGRLGFLRQPHRGVMMSETFAPSWDPGTQGALFDPKQNKMVDPKGR